MIIIQLKDKQDDIIISKIKVITHKKVVYTKKIFGS
jgi:hypothetical protein